MSTPLFTQKHYEHVIVELRRMAQLSLVERGVTSEQLDGATEVLCRIFARDNPKFKASMFVALVKHQQEEKLT